MSKTILVMGSSNSLGDTYRICKSIVDEHGFKFQDLNELVIMPYDYDHENRDDDFLGFMKHVIIGYDTIILATPVYWYSMSGIMKNYLDRFTDLLTIEKDLGRKLRGKNLAAISVSKSDDCPEEYPMPFAKSANYLGMEWKGYLHFPVEDQDKCKERRSLLNEYLSK